MMNVYVCQRDGRIVDVNIGDYTITSEGWTLVYSGDDVPDYFAKGIMTENGGYNYAYINGQIVERSAEEVAADEQAANPTQVSQEERIAELEAAVVLLLSDASL